ncbi:MAG: SPFH/Band 7/PHB domain protein [Proteobacteria bacterium]|nr:SPFH/Band 7/PHB domain protein [Pseudomonadota bacterium]
MFIASIVAGFFIALFIEKFVFGFLKLLGFYITVNEGTYIVLVLFGNVIAVIDEPGLHFLWHRLTWKALIINFFGSVYRIDKRLDQRYSRSQPVNSEEGAPMGVGVWYEMVISDPVSYLFKNADPEGSLAANVSNSTVRFLSNMPLSKLLVERHKMSQTVREDVTAKAVEWGYKVGSVYIRKVHFRDVNMIRQIETKIVNQLRQVTSAIRQDGENQVNIITSSAQKQAAAEFAKAAAIRPKIIGDALTEICKDPSVSQALFDVLEAQKILDSSSEITILPEKSELLTQLVAANKG